MDDPLAHPKPRLTDGSAVADAALMARLACGDAQALDPLYRRHKGVVYRFALLWSGSTATAADVTQDVFVHLLQRAETTTRSAAHCPPGCSGIARNFVRRRTGTGHEVALDADDDALPPAAIEHVTPDIALVQQQDLERLRRAIAALPPHYRDVLVLVELAERSYAEVAAICGCELNTVRSRLFRARGLLARWLALDAGASDAMSAAHG